MPRPRRRPPRGAPAFGAFCRPERVLPVLLTAGLLFAASQTLALPAAPTLRREYGTGPGATAWVLTAFLLSAAVATPVVGALGDRFGKGRALTWVLVVFAGGAVVSALAADLGVLIAGRAVQGVAGGVVPLAFGVVREFFPADRVAGGLAAVTVVFGIGGGCGLALSGVVIDGLGVSWLFWLGLVALPAALAAHHWVPRSPPGRPRPVDWRGALLLGGALSCWLLTVAQVAHRAWAVPLALPAAAAGGVLLLLWLRVERDAALPLVPLRVLTDRRVAATHLAALLIGIGTFAGLLLVTQIAEAPRATGYGLGVPATVTGLLLLPSAAGQLTATRVAARLGCRPGRARLVLGAALAAVAYGLLAAAHATRWPLAAGGFLLGAGNGLAVAATADLVAGAVDRTEVRIMIGVHMLVRTVGGAGGAVLSTAVLELTATDAGAPTPAGYTAGFGLLAGSALLAVGAAGLVPRPGPALLVRATTGGTQSAGATPPGTGSGWMTP